MTKFLNISTDTTLGGSSPADDVVSSQKAIKSYVDSQTGQAPAFANITGQPTDNANLASALNAKQDVISNLATIESGAAAGATALQPNAAITGATKCKITYDSNGLVTAGADLSAGDIPDISATYQLKLTAGDSISISSNTISVSDIDCGTMS